MKPDEQNGHVENRANLQQVREALRPPAGESMLTSALPASPVPIASTPNIASTSTGSYSLKEPQTGKTKNRILPPLRRSPLTRTRVACLRCKTTKQRCDGPGRVPCRRCELYNLECVFPEGVKVTPVTPASIPTPAPAPAPAPAPSPAPTPSQQSQASPPAPVPKPSSDYDQIIALLKHLTQRIDSIENLLHGVPDQDIDQDPNSNPGKNGKDEVRFAREREASEIAERYEKEKDADMDVEMSPVETSPKTNHNALDTINESFSLVHPERQSRKASLLSGSVAFDIVARGILTIDQCQHLFDFFFNFVHSWVPMLTCDGDGNASTVRFNSPLLFHTILLLASSYSTPFPSPLYLTLTSFVNSLVAGQILNPHLSLSTDFLRSICFLNVYKPIQFEERRAEGQDDETAMQTCKINPMASWMLQSISSRVMERIELKSAGTRLLAIWNDSANENKMGMGSGSREIVRDLRLYLYIAIIDGYGSLQSGKRCNLETGPSQSITRHFHTLRLQPFDLRLCALTEMMEISRPIMHSTTFETTRKIQKKDLDFINSGIDKWSEYWVPKLKESIGVDPLAMTVLSPFTWFATLIFNSTAHINWKVRIQKKAHMGNSPAPASGSEADKDVDGEGLHEWEADALERSIRAAENLIFTLSEQSRVQGGWREVRWGEAERVDGWANLILDSLVVERFKYGIDGATCVTFFYPIIYLVNLVKDGLMTIDLELLRTPKLQPKWKYPRKLPRLMELASRFLESIALHPQYPSASQAKVLKRLLESGIKGTALGVDTLTPRTPSVKRGQPMEEQDLSEGGFGPTGQGSRSINTPWPGIMMPNAKTNARTSSGSWSSSVVIPSQIAPMESSTILSPRFASQLGMDFPVPRIGNSTGAGGVNRLGAYNVNDMEGLANDLLNGPNAFWDWYANAAGMSQF